MINLFNKLTVCYSSKISLCPGRNELHLNGSKQGCDWKKEESALLWFVWMSGVVQPHGCECHGWGCWSYTSSRARAPQQGSWKNALMRLLRYNHRGLLGYLWWVTWVERPHQGCAVGSLFQMLFWGGKNSFVMLCKAPKLCQGWGRERKAWLKPNFK